MNTIKAAFEIFPDLENNISNVYLMKDQQNIHLKLPTIWSLGSIHSLLRYDTNRKYRVNDFFDIDHCAIALGYFDYLFTERSFYHIVTNKLGELDKRFNLTCAKNYNDANNILLKIIKK